MKVSSIPLKFMAPLFLLGTMVLSGNSCSKPMTEVEKADKLYEEAQKQVKADSIKYLEYNPNALFYRAQVDSLTRDRDNFIQRALNDMKEMDYDDFDEFCEILAGKNESISAARRCLDIADGTKLKHSKELLDKAQDNLTNYR